uniref:TRPA5-1 n=1 Tax=Nilaparvata lugens TaxID=108931 RepID=A0A384SQP0_NILLU|nr:TRPA5-1 [Nilaparvata lugens]
MSGENNLRMRIRRAGDIKKPVTCLHTVVISGNIELLKSLSLKNDEFEENLSAFDKDGFTPLHRAVIMRRLDIVTTILENGMQHLININDLVGRTLLFLAVEIEWIEGIDYFLNNGAELSLSSQDNSNVLHVAARLGNADLLSELVQFDTGITLVNSINNKNQTPLWNAVKKSSAACVSLLLTAGAQVSLSQPNNKSLLHMAAENSSPETLRLLLDFGKRTMVSEMFEGMTPLQLACRKGLVDCVRVLIEYGGDVKQKTGVVGDYLISRGTCLHLAARYGHLKVVEFLVQFDRSLLSIPNDDNWYPLHVAARSGKVDCVHFMIVHGADLSKQVVDRAGNPNTAVDLIACFIPQPHTFFQRIFDESIETNGHPTNHIHCQIKYKYNVLIPSDREKRQLKALVSLININNDYFLEKTLLHPMIESFLYLKWQRLKIFFIAVVMLYVTFTVSFTALSVTMLERATNNNQSTQQNNPIISFVKEYVSSSPLVSSESVVMFNKLLALGSLLIIGPVEIYQALTLRRCYFLKIESWLKATIMVLTVWTLVLDSDSDMQTRSSISAVIILCSWSELLFLLACLPNWGFSILMFCRVAQNVIKVLVTFSCLIVGFSFAFMVLFQSSEPFVSFWLSFLKVMVMMTEYDYGDLFSAREGQDYLARTIFLVFLILVSIVMMNLMVGIAVSDIALLEDQGRVSRIIKHIDFLDLLEELVYNDVFLKIMPKRAGRSLKSMRAAPSYFTFKIRPLRNSRSILPPSLHQSMINKVDELYKNNYNYNSCPETSMNASCKNDLRTEKPVDSICEQCKSNVADSKLQCILEEIAKLKDELQSMKDQPLAH